jgi:hypothetical protein
MSLQDVVRVFISPDRTITTQPQGFWNNPGATIQNVWPFIVQTQLSILIESKEMEAAVKIATKEKGRLYDKEKMEEDMKIENDDDTPKVFKYTAFQGSYIYPFFCERTRKCYKPPNSQPESFAPETFHQVMIASTILRKMYGDPDLAPVLQGCMGAVKKEGKMYKDYWGDHQGQWHVKASRFETSRTGLPLGFHRGGGIPISNFRRVLSTNLAAVASFFAFCSYDEKSRNNAMSLLHSTMEGDQIENEKLSKLVDIIPLPPVKEWNPNYLFPAVAMDEGEPFVDCVVNVVNRLGECLHVFAQVGHGETSRPNQKSRLQCHLFRTLCSDLVEIYLSHGGYPQCTQSTFKKHPSFKNFLRKSNDNEVHKPVPLLMEYIICLVSKKKFMFALATFTPGHLQANHLLIVQPTKDKGGKRVTRLKK